MSRLKQLNIERYVEQVTQKRKQKCKQKHKQKLAQGLRQTMSLYDERTDQTLEESQCREEKDNLKTWNKWRITMRNKALVFTIMMLIMLIFVGGSTETLAVRCPLCGDNVARINGYNRTSSQHQPRYSCSSCGGTYGSWSNHYYGSWTTVSNSTCTTAGSRTRNCQYCGYAQTENYGLASHSYGSWQMDTTNHWQVCGTCNGIGNNEEHADTDGDNICDTCGYIMGSSGGGDVDTPEVIENYTDGTNYYTTLADAIMGTAAGGTIKVIKSNTDTSTAIFDKNLTLDTDGLTITKNTSEITINSGITVNVTGNGTITTTTENNIFSNDGILNISSITLNSAAEGYSVILNNETVTVNSGTIESGYTIIDNYGTLNVNGGMIKSEDYEEADLYAIKTYDGSSTNVSAGKVQILNSNMSYSAIAIGGTGAKKITGGTVIAEGCLARAIETYSNSAITSSIIVSGTPTITAICNNDSGNSRAISAKGESVTIAVPITISGGTITATATIATNARGIESISNSGITTITGGTIEGGGYGTYINSGAGRLTYGDAGAAISTTIPSSSGGTKGVYAPDGFNFNSGAIKGTDTTPYYGVATPRAGAYEVVIEGPNAGLYSAIISFQRNYQVGSKYYQTLSDAIKGAAAGNTIKVLKNYTDTSEAIVDKNITLDTNGKTITKDIAEIIVNSGATLNITGTGTIIASSINTIRNFGIVSLKNATLENAATTTDYTTILNFEGGTVTINSGTVRAKGTAINSNGMININGGLIEATSDTEGNFNELFVRGIMLDGSGSVKMTGGKISAYNSATGVRAVDMFSNGSFNMSGGEIIAEGAGVNGIYALTLYTSSKDILGEVNINGGAKITAINESTTEGGAIALVTVRDNDYILDYDINISDATLTATGYWSRGISFMNNAGDLTITSGIIHGDDHGVSLETATGIVTIGDSSNAINSSSPEISGGTVGINTSGSFNFYDGVLKGTNATPYAGTPVLAVGNEVSITGPTDSLYSATVIVGANYLVNGTTYSTLEAAIAAASAGNTITVLRNHTDVTNAIVDKNLTLNTNGVTLTKETYPITINSGCTLNVISAGEITGGTTFNTIDNNGTLTLRNATIRCIAPNITYSAINNAATGSVIINSGTVSAKGTAITTYGTIIMNGGVIEGTSDTESAISSLVKAIYCHSGKVTISGGTVKAYNSTKGVRTIDIVASAELNISGGKVIAEGTGTNDIVAITNWAGFANMTSSIKISGGAEIIANNTGTEGEAKCIEISNDATKGYTIDSNINISDATIIATGVDADAIHIVTNAGDLNITSGKIHGDTTGVLIDSSTGTISIGNANDELNNTSPEISGGTYGINTTGSFNFYNGVIKGTNTTPYNGTPVLVSSLYGIETTGPDASSLYSSYIKLVAKYQIKGTSNYYNTLAEAIAGASAGNTIVVIEDNTDTSTATFNKNLTLDTNGKTITKKTAAILINSGVAVDIIGNGTIKSETNINVIGNSGILEITDTIISNLTSTTASVIYNNASGTLTMNSGTISSVYVALNNYGTTYIKGGKIDVNASVDENVIAVNARAGSKTYMSGGNISAKNSSTTKGARGISGIGEKVVSGGEIYVEGYSPIALEAYSTTENTSSIKMSGTPRLTAVNTVEGGYARGISVVGSGIIINVPIEITGGTIIANALTNTNTRAVHSSGNSGTTTITGGTFSSTGYGIFVNSQSGILTFGSLENEINTANLLATGGDYGVYAPNGFNFYNGIIKGTNETPYSGTPTPREGYAVRTKTSDDGLYEAYLGLTNPTITTKLANSQGEAYTPDTFTNKSIFVELSIEESETLYKYEWSTSENSGFTSNNLITFGGIGRIIFDDEMNGTVYFRAIDVDGNYTDAVSTVLKIDKTSPTVMAEIIEEYKDEYNEFTGNRTVNITVQALDNCSTSENMQIAFINENEFNINGSNSNLTWTNFGAGNVKTWELSDGSGLKKVYVIVKDEAGNQSAYLAEE